MEEPDREPAGGDAPFEHDEGGASSAPPEGTGGLMPAPNAGGGPTPMPGGPPFDDRRPRRRGRRGRGGGLVPDGPAGGQPFRPRPPQGGFRPQGGQPFAARPPFRGDAMRAPHRPPPGRPIDGGGLDDEGSSQMRELAAYERRQQQQRRPGGWRPPQGGGGGGWRGGGAAGGRGRAGYDDTIRRVTGGPHSAAPSHDAGEPIAGAHSVLEAIRGGRTLRSLYVSQDRGIRTGAVNEIIAEAQQRRVFVRFVDRLEIARLSPIENHQGVVAIVEGRASVELDELLLHLDTLSEPPLVLVVDSLQDPQNFGVLLRSAEGAGVDGVVIPRHRAVGLTAAVAKTSAGATEHLLVADVANLRQAIDTLKEKGVWVVGADETGDMLYDEVDYRGATAIVVGGEGEGIRRLVLEGCDQVVRIPMEGKVSSLNAAAAGTVVLYEALRQRRRDVAPPGTQTPRPERPADEREVELTPLDLRHAGDDEQARDDEAAEREAAEREAAELEASDGGTAGSESTGARRTTTDPIRGDDEDVAQFDADESRDDQLTEGTVVPEEASGNDAVAGEAPKKRAPRRASPAASTAKPRATTTRRKKASDEAS